MFICNSTGTGKTQQAFALPVEYSVIYIPLDDTQSIYKCFSHLGDCVLKCAYFDYLRIQHQPLFRSKVSLESCSAHFSSDDNRSYLAGFFIWALDTCTYDPKSLRDRLPAGLVVEGTTRAVKEAFGKKQKAVVMLDEVNLDSKEQRLLRNVLRVWGIPVVLMSTNSSAANYIDRPKKSSRGNGVERPWCFLFTTLPKYVGPPLVDSLKRPSDHSDELKNLFNCVTENSRPLFVNYARMFLENRKNTDTRDHTVLMELLHFINGRMHRIKFYNRCPISLFRLAHHHFCMALAFKAAKPGEKPGPHDVLLPVLNSHFATFDGGNRMLYVLDDIEILAFDDRRRRLAKWTPSARFPTPEEEPLLFLACMCHFETRLALEDNVNPPLSFRDVHKLVMAYIGTRSRYGEDLEAIAAGACVVASLPRADFCGLPFRGFFLGFCRNLYSGDYFENLSFDDSKLPLNGIGLTVPHFGPLDQTWPDAFKNLPNALFGKYTHGIVMKDQLYMECMNSRKDLTLSMLNDCVVRAQMRNSDGKTPFIYILVTNSLQGSYAGFNVDLEAAVAADLTLPDSCKDFREAVTSNRWQFGRVLLNDNVIEVHPSFAIVNAAAAVVVPCYFLMIARDDLKDKRRLGGRW